VDFDERGCLTTSPAPDRVGTKSRNTPILWAGVGENSPRDIEMTAEVGRSGVDILVLRQPRESNSIAPKGSQSA